MVGNCGVWTSSHQSLFIIYDTSICVIICLVMLGITTLIHVCFILLVMYDSKSLQSDQSILSICYSLENTGIERAFCSFPCMFFYYLAPRHFKLSCVNECCLFSYF